MRNHQNKTSWSDEEIVLISSLNQYVFCPRRCYLINVEGVFLENLYTLEGSQSHETADLPGLETRKNVRIVRALPLYADKLGVQGKADVIEFHLQPDGSERPYPIEYKRGRKKQWDNDDVQLCAQGLCLEEMTQRDVPEGAIFHVKSKRRRVVPFTESLRNQTFEIIKKVRALAMSERIPSPVNHPKCEGCSMKLICMPDICGRPESIMKAAKNLFETEE